MTVFSLTEAELRHRTSMKWRTHPDDVLPLWVAEMDARQHPAVIAAVNEAMVEGDTGYPWGDAYARAYADMAEQRWGWRPEDAQMRRSGDVMNAILSLLLGATKEGDRIVINPPVYPPFWQVIEGYRRHITQVPLAPSGRLDLEALEAAFAGPQRPSAYLLCSPHNPNGTVHTAEELAAVGRLTRAHGVTLIVDEIHSPLVDPGTRFTPILSLDDAQHAVVTFSAGKGWNLPAFKAGLFIRGRDAAATTNALPPLANQSTGHMATIAHTAALRHAQGWVDEVRAEVASHKQVLASALAAHLPQVRYEPAPGTYLAWLDCSDLGLDDPGRHFLDRGRVALNRGADFGADHGQFVRMNLATSPALIEQAVERMAASVR